MESVFIANPDAKELICFSDGTCFLTDQAGKCGANDYAKKNPELKQELVKRELTEEKPKEKKK